MAAKDAERQRQIEELQDHSASMVKLLLNLTVSEFKDVHREVDEIIAIQLKIS